MTNSDFKTTEAIAYLKINARAAEGTLEFEVPFEDEPIIKPLADELLVCYVVDTGNSFRYVCNRDLASAFVTAIELHETGLRNLMSIAASGRLRVSPHSAIFAVLLDGNFEASMILLDELWNDSFRQFVTGEYLVAFPTRDVLAFCDASSAIGRQELQQIVDRLKDSVDHPLTQNLYIRRGNQWVIDKTS